MLRTSSIFEVQSEALQSEQTENELVAHIIISHGFFVKRTVWHLGQPCNAYDYCSVTGWKVVEDQPDELLLAASSSHLKDLTSTGR